MGELPSHTRYSADLTEVPLRPDWMLPTRKAKLTRDGVDTQVALQFNVSGIFWPVGAEFIYTRTWQDIALYELLLQNVRSPIARYYFVRKN